MQLAVSLVLIFAVGGMGLNKVDQAAGPESALRLTRGQLSLGPYAIGMTVAEVQREYGQPLQFTPNVDDTGQCEGVEAPVSFGGHRFVLTLTEHRDGLRLRAIHVRLAAARDLDEIAAEVVRRVPSLRIAEFDPMVKGNKSAWSLPTDPMQIVLIKVAEGWFSISRGCVNG